MGSTVSSQRHRFSLWGKLVLAILAAGTIPLIVGLSVAYVKGNTQLKEVIGDSFEALAQDTALKLDTEIQRLIAVDHMLAQQAADDPRLKGRLLNPASAGGGSPAAPLRFDWSPPGENAYNHSPVLATWITTSAEDPQENIGQRSAVQGVANARVSGLDFDNERGRHVFRISIPIRGSGNTARIGWLHRLYDVKVFFDPLVYPIRFGDTGHVMLIDNLGAIISCPNLITGSRIADEILSQRVASEKVGWIMAENDGHGSQRTSLIGHAPLATVNPLLEPGISWHMFVWQDSREIFAPGRSLMVGVALAGLLAFGLLGVLGYYASKSIVNPIRRLSREAGHIAAGDLNRTLDIRTGDEIEDLAGEFNEMRIQLRQLIGNLEEKVEERTRELKDTQAEKDQVTEQLIQAEKVAAIGTMASGIGHEINNPLYAIHGMAEALQDEGDLSRCREYGNSILKHTRNIAKIVQNLSGYIRPAAAHDLEPVDVNEKLDDAISLARRSMLSDHVEIRTDLRPVPGISAKPEEIQQAFFNIIRNGIQAMHGKGILEITSREKDHQVWIQIRDKGLGIPKEHQAKIFDPFFTTKGPDEGEGLGLYIVQQIVKKYQGTITLESREGAGTSFTIQFPARETTDRRTRNVT